MTTSASATVPAGFLADGPADVTVIARIQDKDGGYSDYSRTIHVNNVTPAVNAGPDASVATYAQFNSLGLFTDPGADSPWTATVDYDWHAGDTDAVSLALNANKTFTLSHTYTTAGTYAVHVTLTDPDGAVGTDDLL